MHSKYKGVTVKHKTKYIKTKFEKQRYAASQTEGDCMAVQSRLTYKSYGHIGVGRWGRAKEAFITPPYTSFYMS